MKEAKVQYTTAREKTDVERFSAITKPSRLIYLLAIRLLDEERSITAAGYREFAAVIGYGVTDWQATDAIREWLIAGLVTAGKTESRRWRLVFAEHELIPGPCHGSDVDFDGGGGELGGFTATIRTGGSEPLSGYDGSMGAALEALEEDTRRSVYEGGAI